MPLLTVVYFGKKLKKAKKKTTRNLQPNLAKKPFFNFAPKCWSNDINPVLTTHRLACLCCQCDASLGMKLALVWKQGAAPLTVMAKLSLRCHLLVNEMIKDC